MVQPSPVRKLAAIVAVDIAGFSARSQKDEDAAARGVAVLRETAARLAGERRGRIFNTAGDGVMLEFAGASDALEAAAALIAAMAGLRCGVHLGEVLEAEGGDLLGHGVNVAARLQQAADRGGALVSADLQRAVRGPLAHRLSPRGDIRLDKMDETIAVYALVAATHGGGAKLANEPLLAVLPFDNLSSDPDMAFFSDGVSEEILYTVARGAALRTIGRTSSFQFRGADKAPRRVAGELRATHILDGSVRRSGTKVRIAAHLIDAHAQTTLWSERFDRDMGEIFALQDEIAASVAAALQRAFTPARRPTALDPDTYDLILKGRMSLIPSSRDDMLKQIAYLERACGSAPDYARAWGMLASAHALLRQFQNDTDVDRSTARVEADAARAIDLDPGEPNAWSALGFVAPTWRKHIALQRKATELSPDWPAHPLVRGLLNVGRAAEALALSTGALSTDPLNPAVLDNQVVALVAAGRTEEGRALLSRIVERHPQVPFLSSKAIFWSAMAGDWADVDARTAPEALAKYPLLHLEGPTLDAAKTRRHPTVEAIAATLEMLAQTLQRSRFAWHAQLAFAAEIAGAGAVYDLVASKPAPFMRGVRASDYGPMVFFEPFFPALRSDPRFPGLCAELTLAQYWIETGDWPDIEPELSKLYDFKGLCADAVAR